MISVLWFMPVTFSRCNSVIYKPFVQCRSRGDMSVLKKLTDNGQERYDKIDESVDFRLLIMNSIPVRFKDE